MKQAKPTDKKVSLKRCWRPDMRLTLAYQMPDVTDSERRCKRFVKRVKLLTRSM